jgi:polyisoprenoid-binding protein YceI
MGQRGYSLWLQYIQSVYNQKKSLVNLLLPAGWQVTNVVYKPLKPEKSILRKLTMLLFFTVALCANAEAPVNLFSVSNGSISFKSDASLELIKATSNQLKGIINAEKKQFAFTVNVNSFKGFNSPLQQEHFNENYLESYKYPRASFEGKIIEDVDLNHDGYYNIRAKGNLIVHGVSQERILKVELNIKNKKFSIKSNFTVLLADHNITIPKVVNEKLASEIKVEVKADLIEQ